MGETRKTGSRWRREVSATDLQGARASRALRETSRKPGCNHSATQMGAFGWDWLGFNGTRRGSVDSAPSEARSTTARPVPLDVDVRHVRVAIARGHAAGRGLVDARQVLLAELDLHGRHVLLQVRAMLGARDGHDVVALVQHPGQSKLSGRHALLGGERLEALHELAVAAEIVALETWVTGAEIALVAHVVGRAEAAREEAAPDRGVGHEADAELAHGREQALLRVARPERVLGLQRRDGVHRMSTADRLWRGLGQADVADLARLHELGHRTHGLLDRDLLVHTVLVVQVDVLHAEALERGVAGRVHVLRPAVDAHPAAVLAAHVPELRRQHDLVAPPRDGAPDEALVGERTVDVRGVDQGHAQLEGAMDGRHRLVLVDGAVELRHAHAAETHGRHLQPPAAESARLHDVALQCSAWSPARNAPASTSLRYTPAPVRRSRAAVSGSCGPAAARLLCGWGRSGTQTAGAPVSLEFGDFHLASGVAHGETWT